MNEIIEALRLREGDLKAVVAAGFPCETQLAKVQSLLWRLRDLENTRPQPTRYSGPNFSDFDKPGEKWGNA